MKITDVSSHVKPTTFIQHLTQAMTSKALEALVSTLPIISEQVYQFDEDDAEKGWQEGHLHWVPIGRKRGNAGQISLAKRPIAPMAERIVNAIEALIELARQRELRAKPGAVAPGSPREAVLRYFSIPPLDQLPASGKETREFARELARQIMLELKWDKGAKEFAVLIRDRGIGQTPARAHRTLLSLGSSDKGDKPYLIGVFGQGGSSAYAASKYSWVVTRRAADLSDGLDDGVAFTIVKHIIPKGRRDHYFAYLAAHPDGRVPYLPSMVADTIGLKHGTWFAHVGYNFGQSGAAITRALYQALNHVLYNPVLPFDTNIAGTAATIYGNGYRLANIKPERKDLDKVFEAQPI